MREGRAPGNPQRNAKMLLPKENRHLPRSILCGVFIWKYAFPLPSQRALREALEGYWRIGGEPSEMRALFFLIVLRRLFFLCGEGCRAKCASWRALYFPGEKESLQEKFPLLNASHSGGPFSVFRGFTGRKRRR